MDDRKLQLGTLVIAIWGALISSYIAITDRIENRPNVRVNPAFRIDNDENGRLIPQIGIEVINYGTKRVTLDRVGFGWEDPIVARIEGTPVPIPGEQGWSNGRAIGTPELLLDLESGKSWVYWHDSEKTIEDLDRVAPETDSSVLLMVEDQTKNIYLSSPIDIEELRRKYEFDSWIASAMSKDENIGLFPGDRFPLSTPSAED